MAGWPSGQIASWLLNANKHYGLLNRLHIIYLVTFVIVCIKTGPQHIINLSRNVVTLVNAPPRSTNPKSPFLQPSTPLPIVMD